MRDVSHTVSPPVMPSIYSRFDNYDDDKVLRAYLSRHFKNALMTDEEAEILKNTAAGSEIGERIHARIMKRMLDNLDKLTVNRCPECNRVLETPRARQCLWCKHKFHELPRPKPAVETEIVLRGEELDGEPSKINEIRIRQELVDTDSPEEPRK